MPCDNIITVVVFLAHWLTRITLLLISALQLVRKTNDVYQCVSFHSVCLLVIIQI